MNQEHHTGPITTPKQLLVTSFFAFVVPVFIIIALVFYVVTGARTTLVESKTAVDVRIQKVGSVVIKGENAPARTGKQVYQIQCLVCHASGVAGAPKLGDKAVWASRITNGYTMLMESVLNGKGNMPAQSGGDASDFELARAVVYMVNASGGSFPDPVQGNNSTIDGEILAGQAGVAETSTRK